MSRAALAVALGAAVLALAGCTAVPSSSAPQTVEALDTGSPAPPPTAGPQLDADPDAIVDGFLAANATEAGSKHASARAFLTSAARNRWSDNTATIISDESVSTYNAATHTVTVYGRIVGALDQDGIYTPSLLGQGEGGPREPFQFTLATVGGQYRIAQLPRNGLLLTDDQFRVTYQQHVLYFYNLAENSLVPDLRWSAITDPTQLAQWLVGELANPRPDLRNVVNTDTLPASATVPGAITVSRSTPVDIGIPGSSQLDPQVRSRLAEQISQTLLQVLANRPMSITDGGSPVTIPAVNDTTFTPDDFATAVGPSASQAVVYYLDGGRVETQTGKPLPGPLGNGSTKLTSIAVHRDPHGQLLVAGVTGTGSQQQLVVGTQSAGERPTTLRGRLTRPTFAPGLDEAWIGSGSQLYRIDISGTHATVTPVPIPAASGGGRILAVRFSPEGSRIAIALAGASGASGQLYVGSIARGAGQVRVDTMDPISPSGLVVDDVAWLDSLKLFAIGYVASSKDSRTFTTGVDGSEWENATIGNLPTPPDSVTAAALANVWVSADDLVWEQLGTQWVSPVATGQTPGTMPVYLE